MSSHSFTNCFFQRYDIRWWIIITCDIYGIFILASIISSWDVSSAEVSVSHEKATCTCPLVHHPLGVNASRTGPHQDLIQIYTPSGRYKSPEI